MRRASPIVYAHRGASVELPENTLEAFVRGVELGADAIETDAHLTRDGHVVLSHDPTGERMAGVPIAIAASTLDEVQRWNVATRFRPTERTGPLTTARIPTLAEALRALPDTFFNIDPKQARPDMMPALVRTIEDARATERVRLSSFSTKNLMRAHALGYRGPIALTPLELATLVFPPRALARRVPIRGDAAQLPERAYGITFARPEVIALLHERGVRVDFWTIDDPARAKELFAMGADGVVTNDPRNVRAQKSS